MDALVAWSQRFGYAFVFAGRETPSSQSEEWIFREETVGATVQLVRDWRMPPLESAVCYAAVSGPQEVIEPLVNDAWRWSWQHNPVSVAAVAARELTSDPSMILLMALAGAGRRPDPAADAVIRAAIVHADALLRFVTVFAVRQVGWTEYLPAVALASTSDADESVRLLAKETIVGLRA
jgi:hypothetical protein